MQIKEVKRFIDSGLNTDVEPSLMPEGDVFSRKNAVPDEVLGAQVNMKGTISYAYPFPIPPGSGYIATGIGSKEWKEDNSLIYFVVVHDPGLTSGTSYIIKHDPTTGADILVSSDSKLRFDTRYPIKHADIIDGVLYWTDTNNAPRKCNINDAINGTYSITEQFLSAAQYRPTQPPGVVYGTDSTLRRNNLRGKQFQFCYRWIMQGNEKTATSEFSVVQNPEGDELYTSNVQDVSQNNYLSVTVQEGTELVKHIEIFVREGNSGDWARAVRLTKADLGIPDSDAGTWEYKFYNNAIPEGADQDDIAATNDLFPLKADVQKIVNEGSITYGGVTEGRPGVDTEVVLAPVIDNISFGTKGGSIGAATVFTVGEDPWDEPGTFVYSISMLINSRPAAGSQMSFNFVYGAQQRNTVAYVTAQDVATDQAFLDWIASIFDSLYPIRVVYNNGTILEFVWDDGKQMSIYDVIEYAYTPSSEPGIGKRNGFKIGATHPIGLVYTDLFGRDGGVNMGDDVVIPFYTESQEFGVATGGSINTVIKASATWTVNEWVGYYVRMLTGNAAGEYLIIASNDATTLTVTGTFSGAVANTDEFSIQTLALAQLDASRCRAGISWEIKHQPPDWASHWQFVYAGNQTVLTWVQYIIAATTPFVDAGGFTEIDISALNQHKTGGTITYPQSPLDTYVHEHGNRIRFITQDEDEGGTLTKPLGFAIGEYVDMEILGYKNDDPTTNIILVPEFAWASYNLGFGTLAEIYTPRKDTDERVYRGMGKIYEIGGAGGANRYHKGEFQNQDPADLSGTPATGIMYNGDSYVRTQSFSEYINEPTDTVYTDFVEAENMSDFYVSDAYSKGKAYVVLDNPRTLKYQFFRWSNSYITGTQVNGLSKFEAENRTKQLDDSFGQINAVEQAGQTLRVLQDKRPSTIYIGRTLVQSDGIDQDSLAVSSKVLGTISPHVDEVGTVLPNSVCTTGNWTYFFDIYNGKFFRMALNGTFEISGYGQKNYFRNKAEALLDSGIDNIDVISHFDRKHDSVVVTFKDSVNSDNNETIVFYEPSNKWYGTWEAWPEMYGNVGDKLFALNDGVLWQFDASNTRMKLFGVQRDFEIEFYSNINPDKQRVLDAIALATNNNKFDPSYPERAWSVDEVTVSVSEQYPYGQYSRIPAGRFVARQDRLYSDFLRDAYSTSNIIKIPDMINGRKLLSNLFKIKLKHSNIAKTVLSSVEIYSTPAELS